MSTLPVRCTGSGWETTLVEKLEFVEMSARNPPLVDEALSS